MSRKINITVNRKEHELNIEVRETLLEVLRNRLNLTGTKLGCDQQVCGTCTVLLNRLPVSSCSVLAVDADGAQVVTIEGLSTSGELDPVQQAFIDQSAFQCAFCTPGMILAVKVMKDWVTEPTEENIRHFLAGNLCRCGCHMEILNVARSLWKEADR